MTAPLSAAANASVEPFGEGNTKRTPGAIDASDSAAKE
jgi:hypothetical protein